MYYVYLLRLKSGSIYTGSTSTLEQRIEAHKKGLAEATKNLRPVELIWVCKFATKIKALKFEKYLKSGSGQSFRNKHLL